MKTNQKEDVYLVNKILKTKTVKGKKMYLVNWLGYPENEMNWVEEKEIANLKDMHKL
jgi:hypothetical protein